MKSKRFKSLISFIIHDLERGMRCQYGLYENHSNDNFARVSQYVLIVCKHLRRIRLLQNGLNVTGPHIAQPITEIREMQDF